MSEAIHIGPYLVRRTYLVMLVLTSTFYEISGQDNLGIGTVTPDPSAVLDINSTTQGILVPRMSTADRTAIFNPADGLIVYDSDVSAFQYFDGAQWVAIVGQGGWSESGNSNSFDAGHALGTLNFLPLKFRINDNHAGLMDPIGGNTFLGYNAGNTTSTGQHNTAVGAGAGANLSSGSENTLVGVNAGGSLTTGSHNTMLGYDAGSAMVDGDQNVFAGFNAGNGISSGNGNIIFGRLSGPSSGTAQDNILIGNTIVPGSDPSSNVFIGKNAGTNCSQCDNVVAIGTSAGYYSSLFQGGYDNVYIGTNAGSGGLELHHATAIGRNALVSIDNAIVLGSSNNPDQLDVGIGTSTPQAELHVEGYTKLGSDAPKIKMMDLSFTTPPTTGVNTVVAHGISSSKILSVQALIESTANAWIPINYDMTAGYLYTYYITPTSVIIVIPSGSNSILNKPGKLMIIYEE